MCKNEYRRINRLAGNQDKLYAYPFLNFACYPIPLWKTSVAATFLFLGLYFFKHEKPISTVEPEIVYVYKIDTIYKEQPVRISVNIPGAIIPRKKIKKQKNIATSMQFSKVKPFSLPTASATFLDSINLQTGVLSFQKPSFRGRSVKDEGELMDLFVEAN